MSEEKFDVSQARAYAGQYALVVGSLWTLSFLCSVCLDKPMMGLTGNILAIGSVFVLVRLLRRHGLRVGKEAFGFARRWWMSWSTCMYAALLTTFCQWVYFRFFDHGRLMESFASLLESPEYVEALKRLQPGVDPQEFVEALSSATPSSMILSLLMFNFFVAFVCSLLGAAFSAVRERDMGNTEG